MVRRLRSRPTAAANFGPAKPAAPRTSAPHHRPPAAGGVGSRRRRRRTPLLMQWTGTLADETSPELVGYWANTRDSGIVSRRRRPIRSVHAAVAHCWAEGNSEMCLPVRRQYRGGAIRRSRVGLGGRSADVRRRSYARRGAVRVLRGRTRRSRVAQRRCGVARQCSPVSLAPRSTKRGN